MKEILLKFLLVVGDEDPKLVFVHNSDVTFWKSLFLNYFPLSFSMGMDLQKVP